MTARENGRWSRDGEEFTTGGVGWSEDRDEMEIQ